MVALQAYTGKQVASVQRQLNRLPSRKLLKLVKTVDLEREWIRIQDNARLLGKAFTARFTRRGGDPIDYLLQTKAGKFQHELIWERVEALDRLYTMLQLAEKPLRRSLAVCGYRFNSVFALFLAILAERYDHSFLKHVQGFTLPAKDSEQFLKDCRDYHRKKYNREKATPETIERARIFIGERLEGLDLELQSLVMAVIEHERQNNPTLDRRKREYDHQIAHIFDLALKQAGNQRRAGTLRSVQWKEGVHHIGTKGGKYVTKPLQTFPPG